jgi:hypothetical protein
VQDSGRDGGWEEGGEDATRLEQSVEGISNLHQTSGKISLACFSVALTLHVMGAKEIIPWTTLSYPVLFTCSALAGEEFGGVLIFQ